MANPPGSLTRYAAVLEALAAVPEGSSLTDVARATVLPKGSVHRILRALAGVGFVAGREDSKTYVLGPRLLRLLHLGAAPATVAPLVRPVLEDLVAGLGETVFVAKLVGDDVRSVALAVPEREGQSYVQPGRVMPAHAAASAKAIVAYQPEDMIERVLARPLPRYTAKTCTDRVKVRQELGLVRAHGYAACDDELDPGVLSLACPLWLEGAGVVYSIGVVGLKPRLERRPRKQVVAVLREAADRCARRLETGLRSLGAAEPSEAGREGSSP
ncbi:MAG: IclR family transcriptional regulator [Alphaproteobacteria bacterium]